MKRKLQIFVSSTYSDLLEERQAAVAAILKAGHIPAGMELFTAGDASQMETIKRWIDESDVYMLILGGRYGSLETTTGMSYTELEYDYAVALEKPFFAVVIKDDALERKVKLHGTSVIEREKPAELRAFRDKVLNKMSSFFDEPKDIKLAIYETLVDLQARYQIKGWMRETEIPDTTPLIAEISRLSEEGKRLKEENSTLTKRIERAGKAIAESTDIPELIKTLKEVEIDASKLHKDEGNASLLRLFYLLHEALITGIANAPGLSQQESFVYFYVCPKLKVFGLVEDEKVPGVHYRRFATTKLGTALLAYIEKNKLFSDLKLPEVKSEK